MVRRMWLLDQMLRRTVRKGELTVIDHDGRVRRYGNAGDGGRRVTVRLTDRGAAAHIARYPRVGAGFFKHEARFRNRRRGLHEDRAVHARGIEPFA